MTKRRFSRMPPRALCSEWSEDDGCDPRSLPIAARNKVTNRKALQLCRQVERVLSVALEGELVRDLTVKSVVPGPDSSRLLVSVVFHGPEGVEAAAVLNALRDQHARLRSEIAYAIHRKKTPELAFHVERA